MVWFIISIGGNIMMQGEGGSPQRGWFIIGIRGYIIRLCERGSPMDGLWLAS